MMHENSPVASLSMLVTARNTPFGVLREQAGPSLPVPKDPEQWRNSTPAVLMSVFGINRENALVCIVLYMFIAQHNERVRKINISDFKLLQLNTCPLKSLIAAAAHQRICWSLCAMTSSPFLFSWLDQANLWLPSFIQLSIAKKTAFCAFWVCLFGFFFPISPLFPWLGLSVYVSRIFKSSFSRKLPLSPLSCTTPDSKKLDICFNEGGIEAQILSVSQGPNLWDVECIFLSWILACM